jgi:hypothetical protein
MLDRSMPVEPSDAELWNRLHRHVGNYVVDAARAEFHMFLLLNALERATARTVTPKPPHWAGLVKALRRVVDKTAFEVEVTRTMRGAERRGRLRNNVVHTYWRHIGPMGVWGSRIFSDKNSDPTMLFISWDVLENHVQHMRRFSDDLSSMHSQVATGASGEDDDRSK